MFLTEGITEHKCEQKIKIGSGIFYDYYVDENDLMINQKTFYILCLSWDYINNGEMLTKDGFCIKKKKENYI